MKRAILVLTLLSVLIGLQSLYSAEPEKNKLAGLRADKLAAAKEIYEHKRAAYDHGKALFDTLYTASIAWKNAEYELATDKTKRIAALDAHTGRMLQELKTVGTLFKAGATGGEPEKYYSAVFWVAEAKVWTEEESAKK